MNAPAWLTAVVETALNRYLALDPATPQRLAALAGKVMAVEVRGIDLHFFLAPDAHGIRVLGRYEGQPDARLAGAPFSLARLAVSEQGRRALFGGAVDMEGDTALAQSLQDLLNAVDIDWEEQLARLTGDVAAHQIGRAARGTRRWAEQASESLALDITDYLQEELRQLPTRDAVDSFLNDVDTLRADIDRLAARIKRLGDKPGGGE